LNMIAPSIEDWNGGWSRVQSPDRSRVQLMLTFSEALENTLIDISGGMMCQAPGWVQAERFALCQWANLSAG
jgi:hypothetical protein